MIGTGAGGFSSDLNAGRLGSSVVMLEEASEIGTANKTAAWYWIPNNSLTRADGKQDDKFDAIRYMARLSKPQSYDLNDERFGMTEWEYAMVEAFFDYASTAHDTLATRRAVEGLDAAVRDLKVLSLRLGGHLDEAQVERLADLEREAEGPRRDADPTVPALDPLQRGDLEDEMADWLDAWGVSDAWELAPTFVGAGLDAEKLGAAATGLPPEVVADALSYLERRLAVTVLLEEARSSSARISDLVKAIKEYTRMDGSTLQEAVGYAGEHGLNVVMDRCMRAEYKRLIGGQTPPKDSEKA